MSALVLVAVLALAGCAVSDQLDRYKIISVPVEKVKRIVRIKTVAVLRDCPALPKFNAAWEPFDVSAWQRTIIRMYKECAK